MDSGVHFKSHLQRDSAPQPPHFHPPGRGGGWADSVAGVVVAAGGRVDGVVLAPSQRQGCQTPL